MLVVDADVRIASDELRFSFSRSSGPGGQNVNKVNSKVTLHWNVVRSAGLPEEVRERFLNRYGARLAANGDLVVHSQRYRDQLRNRQDCLEKLRQLIVSVRYAPRVRRRTRLPAAQRERRLRDKRETANKKQHRRGPSPWD